MSKYIITPTTPRFAGAITVEYREDGRLLGIVFDTDHAADAISSIFEGIPKEESGIAVLAGMMMPGTKKPAFNIVSQAPTFEEFWKAYPELNGGNKGNKQRAAAEWVKLTVADHIKAVGYLPSYRSALIGSGQFSQHARTYLHNYEWNNK